jgi:hypothetical protein
VVERVSGFGIARERVRVAVVRARRRESFILMVGGEDVGEGSEGN